MDRITQIAEKTNIEFTNDLSPNRHELMNSLYNSMQNQTLLSLLELDQPIQLQTIGTAFAHTAIYYDQDPQKKVNTNAAEYSYYALAKSFVNHNNIHALPPLFSLLINTPELIYNHFFVSCCKTIDQQSQRANTKDLLEKLSKKASFKMQIYDLIDFTAYYLSLFFYDIEKDNYTITDQFNKIFPTKQAIHKHLIPVYCTHNQSWLKEEGQKYFLKVYTECRLSIQKSSQTLE